MEIKDFREQINVLDEQIVELIGKRMDIAVGIGLEKKRQGLPVFDSTRENERLDAVRALTDKPEYKEHMANIYRAIMDETKLIEQQLIDEV